MLVIAAPFISIYYNYFNFWGFVPGLPVRSVTLVDPMFSVTAIKGTVKG